MNKWDEIEDYFRTSRGKLISRVMRRVKNKEDAEDIVQSAFERAFRYSHALKIEGKIEPWISRIIDTQTLDFMVDKNLANSTIVQEEMTSDLQWDAEINELYKLVQGEVEAKGEPASSVLTLRFLMDNSASGISELLQMEQGSVRKSIQRFIKKMREKHG